MPAQQFYRMRSTLPDAFRQFAEGLREAVGEEDGHRPLRRLTSSQAVKRPSAKPRSARST